MEPSPATPLAEDAELDRWYGGLRPGLSPKQFPPHPYLHIDNLGKQYNIGRRKLELFSGLSFSAAEGDLIAIVGQSGAGKSTLLHILAALDAPSSGDIFCGTTQLGRLTPKEAATFRNREVGYVWQFHYLLPEFTAVENVAMPLLARGVRKQAALAQAGSWLEKVGLKDRAAHQAGELSGGEQQRVSLARALITRPRLLLADEPTGDLDAATADAVFELVERLHHSESLTSVIVTHNMSLARRCSRVLRLVQGKLEEVSPQAI